MADENQEIFREKVKLRKFSSESDNFSKIGENLKQGGNASWSQGDGRPCPHLLLPLRLLLLAYPVVLISCNCDEFRFFEAECSKFHRFLFSWFDVENVKARLVLVHRIQNYLKESEIRY